jgi:heme-degrading monooxygenase HmoA
VSIVKINAITVPPERLADFEQRFATRAGRVSSNVGFEAFQLLRPNDDREVCLVVTQWRSEEDFQAWVDSPDFAAGHRQHREGGPVGTASELWSFGVVVWVAPPGGGAGRGAAVGVSAQGRIATPRGHTPAASAAGRLYLIES